MRFFLLALFLISNSLFAQNVTISQKDFEILTYCRARLDFWGERTPSEIPSGSYILPVRQVTQWPNLCVPASASIVLSYYGHNLDQRDIKRLTGANYANNDGRLYSWTLFGDLINGLRKVGYNWREVTFGMTDQDYQQGYNLIVSEIRSGRPVICDSVIMGGHAFVVHGLTSDGSLVISDPNLNWELGAGVKQYRVVHKNDFKQIWSEYDGSFRSVVLTSGRGFRVRPPSLTFQLPR